MPFGLLRSALNPAEEWYCSDDLQGINPGVVFTDPLSGGYRIWVGTFVQPGEYPSVELQVTERDISQTAALSEPPVPGLAPAGEPYYGVVALTAGFEPDPHGINLRAGGTVATPCRRHAD